MFDVALGAAFALLGPSWGHPRASWGHLGAWGVGRLLGGTLDDFDQNNVQRLPTSSPLVPHTTAWVRTSCRFLQCRGTLWGVLGRPRSRLNHTGVFLQDSLGPYWDHRMASEAERKQKRRCDTAPRR